MGRLIYAAGAGSNADTVYVKGVLVDPSAGSWVTAITDAAGKVVFSARGADAVTRYYPIDDTWVGANATTATNITTLFIYTK